MNGCLMATIICDDEFFGRNATYNINRTWKIYDIIEKITKQFGCKLKFHPNPEAIHGL